MAKAAKKPEGSLPPPGPGRPSAYTPVLAERVCQKVIEGHGIERVGKMQGFPATGTIYRWLGAEGAQFDVFREKYARACQLRAAPRFERLREIGESVAEGKMDPQAARAAADIEKWCLARENPRKYGDALTLKGDPKNPLQLKHVVEMTEAELLAKASGEAAGDG